MAGTDYRHPSEALALILQQEGLIQAGEFFVDFMPDFNQINSDYITVIRLVNGSSNPRWLRDNLVFDFTVIGNTASDLVKARSHAWAIFNHLLGAYNKEIDGYTYFAFNSTNIPSYVTMGENSRPIFSFTMSCHRDMQVEVGGNREPIT